jgi:hypothetical protein
MADVTAIRHALADKLDATFGVAVVGEGDAWSVSPERSSRSPTCPRSS